MVQVLRLVLGLSLICAGYTSVQGVLNFGPLAAAWGAAAPWALAVCALGVVAIVMALLRVERAGPAAVPPALRLGVSLLVLWWLVYVLLLQPYDRFAVEVSLGIAAGSYGLCLWIGPRIASRLPPRSVRVADFALFSLCCTLLLLEVSLKVLASIHPSPLLAAVHGAVTERLRSHAFPPGQVRMGFPCNSQGYYDGEFLPPAERKDPVALVIGDSFSAGIVPHELHFTTVAERLLGDAELYNMGTPGIGPDQYLYLLEKEGVPLAPDLFVIDLFAGNDLAETSTARGTDRILARWLDRRNVLVWQVPRRLLAIGEARLAPTDDSRLPAAMPWLRDYHVERPPFARESYLELVTDRARTACAPSADRLDALFRVLERMREAAGEVPLAVVLIPAEFQVEDGLWKEVAARLADVEGLQRDAFQAAVGRWLRERSIAVLDLLPVMRAVPTEPDGDRHLYHLQDTHWNARGNAVAGEALAEFVRPWLAR